MAKMKNRSAKKDGVKSVRRTSGKPAGPSVLKKIAVETQDTAAFPRKKRSKELTELIALGKEKGHLTFEEVNNILPIEIVSSEAIEEILGILGDENIRLVDSEEELAKEAGAVEGGEIQEEKKEGAPKEEISR